MFKLELVTQKNYIIRSKIGIFIDESSCPHFNKLKEVNDIILKWVKTHPEKNKRNEFFRKISKL